MRYFRYIGVLFICIFSFIYTEKIANLSLENSQVYQDILNEENKYNISFVNAEVNGDYIVPGLNGKVVNVKSSFYNMRDINTFNSYYLIYDTSYPDVTVNDFKEKVINKGNSYKKSVSFIIEYDEKIINYFKDKKIEASILVNIDNFNKNEKMEQINNDVSNYKRLDSLISKYSKNSNICYLTNENEKICRSLKKYLVKTDKVLDNTSILKLKDSISSGDIYLLSKGVDVGKLDSFVKSVIYKDLNIIGLSSLLSEERD